MTAYDGKLWGTTALGGKKYSTKNQGDGVVFKINSSGSNFSVVYNFNGYYSNSSEEGERSGFPYDDLIVSDGKIWGSAKGHFRHLVYRIDTTGNDYHEVSDFYSKEDFPYIVGRSLRYNGKLYNTSESYESTSDKGSIFTIDTATYERTAIYKFPSIGHRRPYNNFSTVLLQKGTPQVDFSPIPDQIYGNPPFRVAANSSNEDISIHLASSNQSIAAISGNEITVKGAGTVTISAEQAGDKYYSAASVAQTFTVHKAKLNVTVVDTTKIYGEENPDFKLSYQGFINGDDISKINVSPQVSSPANVTSKPGTYSIVAVNGLDDNYTFLYHPGVLTVIETADSAEVVTGLEGTDVPPLHVYPNPVLPKQELTIHLGATYDQVRIHITTLSGREVSSKQYQHISQVSTMHNTPPGFYLLRIVTDQKPPVSYKIRKY